MTDTDRRLKALGAADEVFREKLGEQGMLPGQEDRMSLDAIGRLAALECALEAFGEFADRLGMAQPEVFPLIDTALGEAFTRLTWTRRC